MTRAGERIVYLVNSPSLCRILVIMGRGLFAFERAIFLGLLSIRFIFDASSELQRNKTTPISTPKVFSPSSISSTKIELSSNVRVFGFRLIFNVGLLLSILYENYGSLLNQLIFGYRPIIEELRYALYVNYIFGYHDF